MPQGWGDSQPCTDLRASTSAMRRSGRRNRALRSTKKRTKESFAALANSLTKKTPYKGPGADSEEKHEPANDIDTAVADSLKALDPTWPIREADIPQCSWHVSKVPDSGNELPLYSITSSVVARIPIHLPTT